MKKFLAIFAVIALVAFAAPAIAAENPFMDVPAGHWAYDAVAQLASRGVASGYPDGSYKGAQPATRYEMASMVARALARMDMEKASKQDVELLKRLVLEFKNELDALGVKVNDLDKRVAVLEDGIGGWKIRGIFRFDASFTNSDSDTYRYTWGTRNEFNKERFRLFLTKTLDENSYLYAQYRTGDHGASGDGRGNLEHMRWSHLFVDTKIFGDWGLRVGRFDIDFENDYDLYDDYDALFGDVCADGFKLTKSFGMLNVTGIVARNNALTDLMTSSVSSDDVMGKSMAYVLDLNFQPSEKFFIGATGYWITEDSGLSAYDGDYDVSTYGIYAGYSFTPNIQLKGIYYFQDIGSDVWNGATTTTTGLEDSPRAWKAILDIKQPALKCTSLWIEYMQMDNTFYTTSMPMYGISSNHMATVTDNQRINNDTTKVLFVKAEQKWNDKWNSFLRFAWADYDTTGVDDAYEYGIGIGYQLNPAIHFELAYDLVDYGSGSAQTAANSDYYQDKESIIRFRTTVSF